MGQHETFTYTPTLYGTATNTHSARESYLQLYTLQHYGGQQETLTHTPILQGTARNSHTHSDTSGDSKKHSHTLKHFRGQQETLTHSHTVQGTATDNHTHSNATGDNKQAILRPGLSGWQAGKHTCHTCALYCPHNLSILAHNHAGYQLLSPVLILSSRILAALHPRLKDEPNELLVVQNIERKTKEGRLSTGL